MHRTTIEVVSSLSPERVVERLRPGSRQAREVPLRARVRDSGVRLQMRPASTYHAPPVLRGVLEPHGDGSVLVGTVREGLPLPITQWGMFAGSGLMLLLLVGQLTQDPSDVEGLTVCSLGAALLMGMGLAMRRRRPGHFAANCEELRVALTATLQD